MVSMYLYCDELVHNELMKGQDQTSYQLWPTYKSICSTYEYSNFLDKL